MKATPERIKAVAAAIEATRVRMTRERDLIPRGHREPYFAREARGKKPAEVGWVNKLLQAQAKAVIEALK